jgi:hypothetical protein
MHRSHPELDGVARSLTAARVGRPVTAPGIAFTVAGAILSYCGLALITNHRGFADWFRNPNAAAASSAGAAPCGGQGGTTT